MTAAERHAQVTDLFHDALEKADDKRAEWLVSACDDPDVLKEVQAMLRQQEEAERGLLDQPLLRRTTDQPETSGHAIADPMLGRRVGP